MKRVLLIGLCASAMAIGCGDDDASSDDGLNGDNNDVANNDVGSNNSNNAGSNNAASNNAGSNNGDTTGSNNGDTTGSNNGNTTGSNNAGSNNAGSNNGNTTGSNNGNTTGAINVDITYSPDTLSVGDDLTLDFDVTGLTLSEANVGGAHVVGEGHYHVYVDTVDPAQELAVGGADPLTVPFELAANPITAGSHDVVVVVHRNDHTEFSQPIQISLPVTVQ